MVSTRSTSPIRSSPTSSLESKKRSDDDTKRKHGSKPPLRKRRSVTMPVSAEAMLLLFCALGIYVCFIMWGIAQENLTTQPYDGVKFRQFMVLDVFRYLTALVVGIIYNKVKGHPFNWPNKESLKQYIICSISSTVAPHFGHMSLNHIDFLTNILGKSCKLIPVVLMKFVLYRQLVEPYKYLCILIITVGVSCFMLFMDETAKKRTTVPSSNSLWGIVLLSINLIIDGVTNSVQDQIFRRFKVTGTSMMVIMNAISLIISLGYIIILPAGHAEVRDALPLMLSNRRVVIDILIYCICGAMGQCFIYLTLERFGSVTLVTVTVTRKMASIIVSVLIFGHALNSRQWGGVFLVFIGILLEAYFTLREKRQSKIKKATKAIKTD